MVTRTRPFKSWWEIRCVRCGTFFTSNRQHAETCGTTCRKAISRGAERRYDRRLRNIGFGNQVPQWKLTTRDTDPAPSSVRPMAQAALVTVCDPIPSAASAAEPPEALDQQLIDQLAELVSPAALDQLRPDQPRGPGLITVELDGLLVKCTEQQYEDMVQICEEEPTAEQLDGDVQFILTLDTALDVVGVAMAPETREQYEAARKRVVNLLAARSRSTQEKEAIRAAWEFIKLNCPYTPRR